MKRISEMTERELIETILLLYTGQEKAAKEIAHHLAVKLAHRRHLIRKVKRAEQTA